MAPPSEKSVVLPYNKYGSIFVFAYTEVVMSDEKYELAKALLTEKYNQLGRLPTRADFEPKTVCFIKQKLGPWNRALEAAGLKAPPEISAKEKSRMKRERAAARRKEARREEKAKANKSE